ncbi:hypothetical protein HKCCE3408_05125 [Rhodobacterales bacterium HKCCE3408]|nr:hypothetical protein [Rhodobacterales bacterium HKCCE3408]
MQITSWLDFVRDFQSLIVGLFGFAGVIITLNVNARIERRARVDAMQHRRLAVITAVEAEIAIYRSSFKRISDFADKVTDQVVVPRMLLRHFDAVSTEIGLLGPVLSRSVLNAVLAIEEINAMFAMEAEEETEYNFSISLDTLKFAVERMGQNGEILDGVLTELEAARDRIS